MPNDTSQLLHEAFYKVLYLYFCQLAATCGLLSSPKNGLVSFTGVTIESEAMYSCFPGFILIGDEIRTCQKNGQWSGQEPHCRGKYILVMLALNFPFSC